MAVGFESYNPDSSNFYDELFSDKNLPRAEAQPLIERINSLPPGELQQRQNSAQQALLKLGATFNVYGDDQGSERIFPFDIIPRIISAQEWSTLERGLKQRIHALNLFIADIYSEQKNSSGWHHSLGYH